MISENQERSRLGLRLLKTNWIAYRVEDGEEDWKMTPSEDWLAKKTHRDSNGKLVWEEDYYYSRRTFTTEKGVNWEMLSVQYDYQKDAIAVFYVGRDSAVESLVDRIGIAVPSDKLKLVDDIVKRWGISRL